MLHISPVPSGSHPWSGQLLGLSGLFGGDLGVSVLLCYVDFLTAGSQSGPWQQLQMLEM